MSRSVVTKEEMQKGKRGKKAKSVRQLYSSSCYYLDNVVISLVFIHHCCYSPTTAKSHIFVMNPSQCREVNTGG